MDDPNLKKVKSWAKLTASQEGLNQIEKEIAEEKHNNEFQRRLTELEKISLELRNSNELTKKQADEANRSSHKATALSIISLIFSSLLSFGSLVVAIIALWKG